MAWVKVEGFWLEKAGLPETVIPATQRVSTPSTNDNMVQEGDIHSCCGFPKLPGELDIRRAGRWIAAGMVVWVITYYTTVADFFSKWSLRVRATTA